jgi:hypothetical protein
MSDELAGSVFDVLHDRLDAGFPRAWRPDWKPDGWKKGDPIDADTIDGFFVQIEEAQTRGFGSAHVLVLAQHPSGELRSVWLLHSAIREKVLQASLVEGDAVSIRYLGLRMNQEGTQEYHDYRFAFKRSGQPIAPPIDKVTPSDAPDFDPENPGA